MEQELFFEIPTNIIWNFSGGTMLNKQGGLTYGDLSLCSILWIGTYAQYFNGNYLFKLKDLMEGLGLSSKSTNNRQLPKIRTALVELQNNGLLISEKPMNNYRLDEWIICQLYLKDEGVPILKIHKIYKGRIKDIIDTVGSKNIVKCLIVETVYRSNECSSHYAIMPWSKIAPKINAVMSKHETWNKYVKIMEDNGLLFTRLKYKDEGSIECKVYADNPTSLNLRMIV